MKSMASNLDVYNQISKEWAKAGDLICNGCGAHLGNAEFKLCEKCRQYHRDHGNRTRQSRMERKLADGACAACSAKALHKSRYCKKHFLDNTLRKYGISINEYDLFWEKLEHHRSWDKQSACKVVGLTFGNSITRRKARMHNKMP